MFLPVLPQLELNNWTLVLEGNCHSLYDQAVSAALMKPQLFWILPAIPASNVINLLIEMIIYF